VIPNTAVRDFVPNNCSLYSLTNTGWQEFKLLTLKKKNHNISEIGKTSCKQTESFKEREKERERSTSACRHIYKIL